MFLEQSSNESQEFSARELQDPIQKGVLRHLK